MTGFTCRGSTFWCVSQLEQLFCARLGPPCRAQGTCFVQSSAWHVSFCTLRVYHDKASGHNNFQYRREPQLSTWCFSFDFCAQTVVSDGFCRCDFGWAVWSTRGLEVGLVRIEINGILGRVRRFQGQESKHTIWIERLWLKLDLEVISSTGSAGRSRGFGEEEASWYTRSARVHEIRLFILIRCSLRRFKSLQGDAVDTWIPNRCIWGQPQETTLSVCEGSGCPVVSLIFAS